MTGLQLRMKYYILPEEAQNAVWVAIWSASKMTFYRPFRRVIDICHTTSIEPMASYARHEFRFICHLIWTRYVSINIINHHRTMHLNPKVSSLRPLKPDGVAYRDESSRFSYIYHADCQDRESGHYGAESEVTGGLQVLWVQEHSIGTPAGLKKQADAAIFTAASSKLRREGVPQEIPDQQWFTRIQ